MSYGYYPPPQKSSNTWVFVLLGTLLGGGFLLIALCGGIGMAIVYALDAAERAAKVAQIDVDEVQTNGFPTFERPPTIAPPPYASRPTPYPTAPSYPSSYPSTSGSSSSSTSPRQPIDSFDSAIAALNSSDTTDDRDAIRWIGGQPVDSSRTTDVTAGLVACIQRRSNVRDALPQLVTWAGDDVEPLLLGYVIDPESVGNDSFLIEESMRILHERGNDELARALVGIIASNNVRSYEARRYLKLIGASAEDDVLPLMNHKESTVRTAARELLTEYGTTPEKMTTRSIADLDSTESVVRLEAARFLRDKGVVDASNREILVSKLLAALEDGSSFERVDSVEFFLQYAGSQHEDKVIELADETDSRIAGPALKWLGQHPSAAALSKLRAAFADDSKRRHAVPGLKAAGAAAEEIVLPYLDDRNYIVQIETLRLLEEVGTQKTLNALQAKYRASSGRGGNPILARKLQESMEALKIRLTLQERSEEKAEAAGGSPREFRVWTDVTGSYTIDAAFVRKAGNVVTLRRRVDGGEVDLPLDQLCEADRKYVDGLR